MVGVVVAEPAYLSQTDRIRVYLRRLALFVGYSVGCREISSGTQSHHVGTRKGRGAASNWKNCAEDIWFCTLSDDYRFNTDAVKLRRRVKAPYRDAIGRPKDWESSEAGNFRLTHASNLWTDVTVPFWSMPENTDHPNQKPEKLIAKLILASTNPADVVFDPFLGSGTTSVVAAKLGRDYIGVEIDRPFCEIAEKRLAAAGRNSSIQGYADGVFWERNSLQPSLRTAASRSARQPLLFREHAK